MNIIVNELSITITTHDYVDKWVYPKSSEPYIRKVLRKLPKPMLMVESRITAEMPGQINSIYTDGYVSYTCVSSNGIVSVLYSTGNLSEKYRKPTELLLISGTFSEATF